MDGARILIAGCGDLGLRTAQHLLARPDVARVYGLRRHPPSDATALPSGMAPDCCASPAGSQAQNGATGHRSGATWRWLAGDLSNPSSLGTLPEGITHVMYTPTPGERSAGAYERVFLTGQRHLHEALYRCRARAAGGAIARWLFVSSSAVYGDHQGSWIDEATPTAPQGINGQVLCAAESWLHAHEPAACVLRLAGLYGPGRVQLLKKLRAGRARAPFDLPHVANRIHIDDAARACEILLMHASPEALYLGADDQPQPLHILYAALADMVGGPPPQPGPPPANIGSKRMRNTRLRAAGWAPRYPDAIAGYRSLVADMPSGD